MSTLQWWWWVEGPVELDLVHTTILLGVVIIMLLLTIIRPRNGTI